MKRINSMKNKEISVKIVEYQKFKYEYDLSNIFNRKVKFAIEMIKI